MVGIYTKLMVSCFGIKPIIDRGGISSFKIAVDDCLAEIQADQFKQAVLNLIIDTITAAI